MDIGIVFNQMLTMMLMLCVGVIGAKAGILDGETNRRLTRFALTIPQSAIILASAMDLEQEQTPGRVVMIIGIGCVMYALLLAMSYLIPRLARVEPGDRGVYSFLGTFGNVAFMGYPILRAVYGGDAVFYAALMGIPFNLLAFTLGVRMLGGRQKIGWRQLCNPALVSSVIAVIIIFLPISWPAPATEAANYLGDMIIPLSMLIIGASLGEQRLRDVFLSWRAYLFAPVKLLLAPLLVWVVTRLFLDDALLLGIVTMEAAMPSATVAVMLSIQHRANERLAAQVVFVTTVLSAATIPFICWLLL